MAKPSIPITGVPEADRFLVEDPLALLLGMLLDQQVPMEWAFKGPFTLRERLDARPDAPTTGGFTARAIAAMDPDEFVSICCEKPAIHRFPGSMGQRVWEVCQHVTERYDGDAAKIWKGVRNAEVLYARLREVPGYGDEKAKIFIAILAKRFGRQPAGWQDVAVPFGDDQPRSVADVADAESLLRVREWKKAMKAAKKSKQDAL